MKATIHPSKLGGSIQAPASKSSMQRACAAALIAGGSTIISNPGHSNDDKAALDIIARLGAIVTKDGDQYKIESKGVQPTSSSVDCGESGLSIRMFTPIVALSANEITITGHGSLVTRPMDFFDEILPQLGVRIISEDSKLPLVIQGPLKPADITVDGSLSSQFLTGLLMAYSVAVQDPANTQETYTITVNDLKSKPYIDLTLEVMKQFNLPIPEHDEYKTFTFRKATAVAGKKRPAINQYSVEGDWSGGAFLLVAGAIAGPMTVRGLDLGSTQADRRIVDALMDCGAGIAMEAKGIKLVRSEMHGFYFDATDCPDLFPPLVALAAYCKGRTTIHGLSRLQHKESDRGVTLQDEFDQMGITIRFHGDDMIIQGGGTVKGADVHSNHDHRIAMACAVAALGANSEMVIDEAQAINKSYPDFFKDLEKMGANVSLDTKIKLI